MMSPSRGDPYPFVGPPETPLTPTFTRYLPQPVNEWQASRILLESLLHAGKLDGELQPTARLVITCLADAALQAESPQAKYLFAVRHALFVPYP